VERDVEAPEVFDVTAEGLWDGRPSLGGVWVAHSDATDPERVIIRNTETGRFVIGALFRRERENPGPPIQVSSEAAAALDILAGAPAVVQITALRREEVSAEEDMPLSEELAAAPAPADTEDLPEVETAALTAVDDAELPTVEPAAAPAPERRSFFGRLFGAPRRATAPAAEPVATMDMSAEEIAAGIRPGEIVSERLDPIAAVASAAIAESEAVAVAAPAPIPVSAPAPRHAAAPAGTPMDQPFVQIGIFSVQENANNTGQALRNAGLVPTIYDQTSNGRQFWRVVVGPAPTAEDRAAVLETVRGLGFEDAYFVTR
jgi:rare lipoprotein A